MAPCLSRSLAPVAIHNVSQPNKYAHQRRIHALTSREKGSFAIKSSVVFWYRLISLKATVPGLYRCRRFTPPVEGVNAATEPATPLFRGALPGVLFPPRELRGRPEETVRAIAYLIVVLPTIASSWPLCKWQSREASENRWV